MILRDCHWLSMQMTKLTKIFLDSRTVFIVMYLSLKDCQVVASTSAPEQTDLIESTTAIASWSDIARLLLVDCPNISDIVRLFPVDCRIYLI